MRNSISALLAITLAFIACDKNDDPETSSFSNQTLSMGSNSINDVYFNLSNGEVSSVNRTDWDLAFSIPLQTATILINEGAGVELYSVGDTNYWESVSELDIDAEDKRFNSDSDWLEGAFNKNAAGFPNYGWGTYHAAADHNVGGDSVYIIKLSDGSLKKFMVRVKLGANGSSIIRWSDLNGENEFIETVPTVNYGNKHFIHFSLVNNEVVETEPDKTEWDLLFARYVTRIPIGPSAFLDYPVMGVLSNPDVMVAKVEEKDPESLTSSDVPGDFSDAADAIGSEWKVSDPVTHEISIVDSVSYFIKSVDGNTYLLYFTEYGGNEAGTIDFKVKKIE